MVELAAKLYLIERLVGVVLLVVFLIGLCGCVAWTWLRGR